MTTSLTGWRKQLSTLRGRVPRPRALIAAVLDRPAGWQTPFSIVDSGGLYVGRSGAWLYHELPLTVLRIDPDGNTELDALLLELARGGPERDVHLLIHSWEEQATVPAGTPDALAEYLAGSHTFFVPSRRLLLGVRIEKSGEALAAEGKGVAGALAVIDTLLGEKFPDLSAWDADRDQVTQVLTSFGGTTPSPAAASHLESWYTLGASADVDADELDDVIMFGDGAVAEMVAAAGLTAGTGRGAHALMSAGRRGATVGSVRGKINRPGRAGNGTGDDAGGSLSSTSVVLGRRASGTPVPWGVTLREYPTLLQRPLPMRQLDALEETLPGSDKKVSATLSRIRAAQLRAAGFADTQRIGDDVGLFVGLASPGFAYPFYLNPTMPAPRPVTLVTGASGSGKTFTCEHLAVQSAAAGQRVIYLSTGADGGTGLRELLGAADLPLAEPGILSPYRWLPAEQAHTLARQAVLLLVPELNAEERADIATGFRRSAAVGQYSFSRVFELADGTSAVAKVRRAALRSQLVASMISSTSADTEPLTLPQVTVANLSLLLPMDGEQAGGEHVGPVLADLAAALLIEHALAVPDAGGTMVVLDGAMHQLTGPLTVAAAGRLADATTGVHLVAATGCTAQVPGTPLAGLVGRVIAHAEDSPDGARAALALAGLPADETHVAWLAAARPVMGDGQVLSRPALAVHRDVTGRHSSVLVGPVPAATLAALTRGRVTRYPGWE